MRAQKTDNLGNNFPQQLYISFEAVRQAEMFIDAIMCLRVH